jgi:hypothetical protein
LAGQQFASSLYIYRIKAVTSAEADIPLALQGMGIDTGARTAETSQRSIIVLVSLLPGWIYDLCLSLKAQERSRLSDSYSDLY